MKGPVAAHVLPLVVFMVLGLLPGWIEIENPELPWYRRVPEHWVYPLQTLLAAGVIAFYWRHYRWGSWSWRWAGAAAVLGLGGIAIWVLPAWVYETRLAGGEGEPGWWEWLGLTERREGYDPGELSPWPLWEKAGLAMRFVRMGVVVPIVEELFWRGFLMRWVMAEGRPFQKMAFGRHGWKAFWITTLGVTLIHSTPDMLAAFAWGSLVYVLAIGSKRLGMCVLMHAVANVALGLYVLETRQWGFW
jgi:CAAX prenyl protease-like protein